MFTLTVQKCYHPGMEITEAQYERIAPVLPVQRGNVKLPNLQVLNAILYVARAGLQVARAAAPLRQLAYRLHTDEPLVEEWGARPGV